jgi:hypothetical protein
MENSIPTIFFSVWRFELLILTGKSVIRDRGARMKQSSQPLFSFIYTLLYCPNKILVLIDDI